MSSHVAGICGLIVIFLIGTLRPVNLGALALVATFIVGTIFQGENVKDLTAGLPVDLLVLLVGVTYLFAIAERNGTVERVVVGSARWAERRRALIPWVVFVLASLPPMAGALGSAGVALLAPLALRLAERYDIDRRMIGLMVVHGAGAGNFSPLNVLSAIVVDAVKRNGLTMSVTTLFLANLAYNIVLAIAFFIHFGGLHLRDTGAAPPDRHTSLADTAHSRWTSSQISTLGALLAVGFVSLGFGLNIGFVALTAAVSLHLVFPTTSEKADKRIAWDVVLLVCGIVTYVAALQRHGTVNAVGSSIAAIGSPLLAAFLLCVVGAVTSAFASSAGILGALVPLAVPLMSRGAIGTTGLVTALAISATVVDATPFSTVGALVVANASDDERQRVYRGLLAWGGLMVLTAPILTWLLFVLI